MADVSCRSAAPGVLRLLRQGISDGLHFGAQIYVNRAGAILIDDAIGEAAPGESLTPQHVLPWRSAGKPITAAAVLKCCEQGRLALDQRVADVIPRFASGGKQHVTLRHLLTHTVAFKPTPPFEPDATWDETIESICDTPLRYGWDLETHAAYEPVRSWFILGELLQRVEGRAFSEIIEHDWFVLLGMNHSTVTAPTHASADRSLIMPLYVRTPQGLKPLPVHESSIPSPGASLHGPIRDLARFYEMLLARGKTNGVQFLAPDTVAAMTTRHRAGRFDQTFLRIVDFGLGVICDSNQYGRESVPYGFGRHCSPATFGHGGAQSSIAFADPRHNLVVALLCNGCPGEPAHQRRFREVLSQLYLDLAIAEPDGGPD